MPRYVLSGSKRWKNSKSVIRICYRWSRNDDIYGLTANAHCSTVRSGTIHYEGMASHSIEVLITAPFHKPYLTEHTNTGKHEGVVLHLVFRRPLSNGKNLADSPYVDDLKSAQVIICELDRIDERTLRECPHLQAIIVCRSNPVNIDLAACHRRGIRVLNTPGRNADATADLTMCLMLDALRHVSESAQWLSNGKWSDADRLEPYRMFRGPTLRSQTLGIVGYGQVGRRVAQRALSFGMKVCVYSRSAVTDRANSIEQTSFDELLHRSDIVSLHLPVTPATSSCMASPQFAAMKDGSYLINTARAQLVDKGSLLSALHSGKLAFAAVDVLWDEPIAMDDELLTTPHLLITPHIAGASDDVVRTQSQLAAHQLWQWIASQSPQH